MTGSHTNYRNNNIRVRDAINKGPDEFGTGTFRARELAAKIGKVRGRELDAFNITHFLHEREDVVYRGMGIWERVVA